MKQIKELPIIDNILDDDYFEILESNVSYFTHSFFKYPAKFIPQIPKWAIENFSNESDFVLDCFAGSGTTLVEASLLNRIPLGIDFDNISLLLSNVKTSVYNEDEKSFILNSIDDLIRDVNGKELPDLKNLNHWFPEENINKLNSLYYNIIDSNFEEKIKNFYLVCFISIVRKSSFSDEVSPKPYISSKIKKIPQDPFELFKKIVISNISKLDNETYSLNNEVRYIGTDARFSEDSDLFGKIKLICTSPPYINAFDYVRILRLENIWLRNLNESNILKHKEKQIGTEQIFAKEYSKEIPLIGIEELDNKIKEIYLLDKKRGFVVYKYFIDMKSNLSSMFNYLQDNGHYVMVVGDCVIKGIEISTYKYIIELSKEIGYIRKKQFSYLIKNPYLRIPRKSRGGLIKYDRIIVLQK